MRRFGSISEPAVHTSGSGTQVYFFLIVWLIGVCLMLSPFWIQAGMKLPQIPSWAFPVLIGIIGIAILGSLYNSVIAKKNEVTNVASSIDAVLKKRWDLVPNLIALIKGYMKYEADTLAKIVKARASLVDREETDDAEKLNLENELTKSLGKLFALAENYPDLKSSQNFLQLQSTLVEIEEQLSAARRAYNSAVTEYNNCLEMFPTNLMALFMGMSKKDWFEIDSAERTLIDVSEEFNS